MTRADGSARAGTTGLATSGDDRVGPADGGEVAEPAALADGSLGVGAKHPDHGAVGQPLLGHGDRAAWGDDNAGGGIELAGLVDVEAGLSAGCAGGSRGGHGGA